MGVGVGAQMRRGEVERAAVELVDKAEAFRRLDDLARADHAPVLSPQAKQAFMVSQRAGLGVDNGLEGEADPVLVQRAQHIRARAAEAAVCRGPVVSGAVEAVAGAVQRVGNGGTRGADRLRHDARIEIKRPERRGIGLIR